MALTQQQINQMQEILIRYASFRRRIPGQNDTPIMGEGLANNQRDQQIIANILESADERDKQENFHKSDLESLDFLLKNM